MSLEQLDAANPLVRDEVLAETKSLLDRVLTAQAILLIGIGLTATMAWTALLGWLLCRAVLLLGVD